MSDTGSPFARPLLRGLLRVHRALLTLLKRRVPRDPYPEGGQDILLTGTFYSENWIAAHLRPLAASAACRRIRIVSVFAVPSIPKVELIRPPHSLVRVVGAVPARLATFAWRAVCDRPDIVGGFHLLINGLVAAFLARLVGARSLYFCVGGPMEVIDGGIHAENRLFARLGSPDPVVEQLLVQAVSACDIVVTMGSKAIEFFRTRGVATTFHAVPGGIDRGQFRRGDAPPEWDLILVARLAQVKRIDIFLRAVALVKVQRPEVRAVVVGEGEERGPLERLARELCLVDNVTFAGQQNNVEDWLSRSRVFVLTSDSEGLPLSLMEAMLSGLPGVVPDIGELSDLITDGQGGYLVRSRNPEAFAEPILRVLADPAGLAKMGDQAREGMVRYETGAVTRRWDLILGRPTAAPQAVVAGEPLPS